MKKVEFKVKINDVEETYMLREPSPRMKRDAAEYKGEVFKREAFKKDENGKLVAVFQDQVYNLMREKGIWSDKDQEELTKVSQELEDKITLVNRGKSKEVDSVAKLREIVIKDIKELRSKQFALLSKSNKFSEITVESICNEAELDYLVCFSLRTDGDDPVYSSLEDYKNGVEELNDKASHEMSVLLGNSDPQWYLKLPENKILSKHKLIDEKGHYVLNGVRVNSDGKKINEDGFLINDNGEAIDENGNLIGKDGEPIYTPFDEETPTV